MRINSTANQYLSDEININNFSYDIEWTTISVNVIPISSHRSLGTVCKAFAAHWNIQICESIFRFTEIYTEVERGTWRYKFISRCYYFSTTLQVIDYAVRQTYDGLSIVVGLKLAQQSQVQVSYVCNKWPKFVSIR